MTNRIEENVYNRFPAELREHQDMAAPIMNNNRIRNMKEIEINEEKITKRLKKLKEKKAAGPDGLKPEIYKVLANKKKSVNILSKCMQNEVKRKEKPNSWKKSKTKMIKKVKKPKINELRPIALTNISYKIFMAILKEEIENHIEMNGEKLETQAGFTKGGRIEDNLFILSHCVERSYKEKKGLVVIAIDFKKAYDSIKREGLIEIMKDYRIHPDLIQTVAQVYQGDTTKMEIGEEIVEEMEVTSGIKQGCTGSTTLFKMITYKIIKELEEKGEGYSDDAIKIGALFFADDGLVLAKDIETAKRNIEILINICEKYGLQLNKEKSNIMIYNIEHNVQDIEGIKVVNNIKYLGMIIDNTREMFTTHKKKTLEKAEKMANMTYPIIAKSCNKVLVGKTYWKGVALPTILYGAPIVNWKESEIQKLQRIENGVGRVMLGAPRYAVIALRGEIGISEIKTRII